MNHWPSKIGIHVPQLCPKYLQSKFQLLELNPGSERTGKSVADLFSEASQSHSVAGQRGGADFTKLMKDIELRHKAK